MSDKNNATVATNTFTKAKKNIFGLTDFTLGCIVLILSAFVGAIDSICLDVAEDDGVAVNAMTLYAAICTFIGSTSVDAFMSYTGAYGDGKNWFVLVDIWQEKQRNKFFEIPKLWQWVLLACIVTWFLVFLALAAYTYVSDIGDAIAIYDAYPIFVPLCGLCFATGEDWKHRYFISLFLIVIGIIFFAQPGFIFGYSSDVNTQNQLIGCLLALSSAITTAFWTVTYIMAKKLTYLDLMIQQAQYDALVGTSNNNETIPLKNADALENESINTTKAPDGTLSPPLSPSSYAINAFSGDEGAFSESMVNMMSDIEESKVLVQSNEYIIQNDWAFTNFFVEYYSLMLICQCLIFSPFDNIKSDSTSEAWFWDELSINYSCSGSKCLWYTISGAVCWWLDSYLYFYGAFKVVNAPVVSILDISDIFFTFILSYIWLNEVPNTLEVMGAIIVIFAITICVYPWEKFIKGSKYEKILKNF